MPKSGSSSAGSPTGCCAHPATTSIRIIDQNRYAGFSWYIPQPCLFALAKVTTWWRSGCGVSLLDAPSTPSVPNGCHGYGTKGCGARPAGDIDLLAQT